MRYYTAALRSIGFEHETGDIIDDLNMILYNKKKEPDVPLDDQPRGSEEELDAEDTEADSQEDERRSKKRLHSESGSDRESGDEESADEEEEKEDEKQKSVKIFSLQAQGFRPVFEIHHVIICFLRSTCQEMRSRSFRVDMNPILLLPGNDQIFASFNTKERVRFIFWKIK